MSDEFVQRQRQPISGNDRQLVEALNVRLELVTELKRYKEENAIDFVDPDREAELLDELVRSNPGPLSEEGLRAFFTEVLALTKRELG